MTSVVTEHEKTKILNFRNVRSRSQGTMRCMSTRTLTTRYCPLHAFFFPCSLLARACAAYFSLFVSLSFFLSHSLSRTLALSLSLARAISLCTRARARTCACALLVGGGLEQVMLMDQHMVDISTFPLWVRVLCLNLVSSARTLHCAIVSSGKGPAAEW